MYLSRCLSYLYLLVALAGVNDYLAFDWVKRTGRCIAATNTAAPNTAVLDLFHKTYKGDGTYYGKVIDGSCTYSKTSENLPPAAVNPRMNALVALNAPQYLGSLTCGLCMRVIGSGNGKGSDPLTGTFNVFVKDLCPECKEGDVDFALEGDGRWDITIQAVQCPVGSTSIQYSFQGSNQWYVKLQIRNARIPITEVEMEKKGVWINATHSPDGFWEVKDNTEWQEGPINIRMTAANGEKLSDVVPRIENDVIMEGKVQVSPDPTLPIAQESNTTIRVKVPPNKPESRSNAMFDGGRLLLLYLWTALGHALYL